MSAGESDAADVTARARRSRHTYGPHPDQTAELFLPARADGPRPVVVLIHGGFWREPFRADLMVPLAEDLAANGFAAFNIEYRRVGGAGGHPQTFLDVAAAVDELASLDDEVAEELDLARVVTVGHSAGGHLAVWAAARHVLPTGVAGAEPLLRPCAAISQAGVVDLALAIEQGLGQGAVEDLLAPDVQANVSTTSPAELVPIGVPVTLVHGTADRIVPLTQSQSYAERASGVGDTVDVVALDGDHFDVIDPRHRLWGAVLDALADPCG